MTPLVNIQIPKNRYGLKGPYGFYVQLEIQPKIDTKEKSISDINLDYALELLALPRMIGKHPETDEPIMADYGRYGPYIKSGKQNASLRGRIF